jgi:hypothetical protein
MFTTRRVRALLLPTALLGLLGTARAEVADAAAPGAQAGAALKVERQALYGKLAARHQARDWPAVLDPKQLKPLDSADTLARQHGWWNELCEIYSQVLLDGALDVEVRFKLYMNRAIIRRDELTSY